MSLQCKGITNKDTRCKRTGSAEYCHQHIGQKTEKKYIGLPRKVQTVIKRGPSKTDSKGHIYVYYLKRDSCEKKDYWKIGRTTQSVSKRLSQWNGSILKKSYEVKYNKMAERIIHLMLDRWRIYRYEHSKGYHSIYKSDGKPIKDSQYKEDIKLEALTKHVEWFLCDWTKVKQVIEATIGFVNKIK